MTDEKKPLDLIKPPFLEVKFTYDHAAGIFTAHLANGASIPVDRADVSGRLGNALQLFGRAVVNSNSGKWVKPIPISDRSKDYEYDESMVRRFDQRGLPKLTLDDLGEFDLGDLSL